MELYWAVSGNLKEGMRRNGAGVQGFFICLLKINDDPGNPKSYEPKAFSEGWKYSQYSKQKLEDSHGE